MSEEWRIIPSSPSYEVSSTGRVRRLAPYRATKVGHVLKPSRQRSKHLLVRLCEAGKPVRATGIHRLVAEAFHGPAPTPKHVAAHNNGIPFDNRPDNIRWATNSENMADRRGHGTDPLGERNPNARLTATDVLLIRSHAMYGEKHATLSRLFGIPDSHVTTIVRRKQWQHLEF